MKMRNLLLPLAITAGLATTAAFAADLANNTGGPTTLAVGVPATFTMIGGINTLALPAGVLQKIVITTTSNLGSISSTGPGWGSCTTTCTRSDARAAIALYPTLTVTTTPTAAGPFKICGTISFVPNASTVPDPLPANDQSCVQGQVNPSPHKPDLAIKKGIIGSPTNPGAAVFVINAFNQGPGAVNPGQAKITDNLDSTAFHPAVSFTTSSGWNCSATVNLAVSCTNTGTIAPSSPFPQIKFQVKTKKKGSFRNQADIVYVPGGETVLNNNSALIPFNIN